jgi:hypothetical protein
MARVPKDFKHTTAQFWLQDYAGFGPPSKKELRAASELVALIKSAPQDVAESYVIHQSRNTVRESFLFIQDLLGFANVSPGEDKQQTFFRSIASEALDHTFREIYEMTAALQKSERWEAA